MSQRRGRKTEWGEGGNWLNPFGKKKTHCKRQYLRCKYLSIQYLFYRYKNRTRKVVFAIRIKNNIIPCRYYSALIDQGFIFKYIWHAQRLSPFTDRLKSDFFSHFVLPSYTKWLEMKYKTFHWASSFIRLPYLRIGFEIILGHPYIYRRFIKRKTRRFHFKVRKRQKPYRVRRPSYMLIVEVAVMNGR